MLQTIYCVHVYYIKVDQLLLLYKKKKLCELLAALWIF